MKSPRRELCVNTVSLRWLSLAALLGVQVVMGCSSQPYTCFALGYANIFQFRKHFQMHYFINSQNLDPVKVVCMYCLTDRVSGFACGDHADY